MSTASGRTAASSCRRRSCRRSRSSRRPGSTARDDPEFQREFQALLKDYVGRPSPLYHAARLSEAVGHPVYLKREDLNHTGAHKINNAIGQCLLAKRLGKHRIIAETGAGQHGVATATACALLGLECIVYMGTEDMRRQQPNVLRMELLGAKMAPVDAGTATLKEAISAAIRDWTTTVETTHYVLGTCAGPAPFPALVRDLQRVIGDEARAQVLEQAGRLPDRVIACVGGGSNAIGIFTAFVPDDGRRARRRRARGRGDRDRPPRRAAHDRRSRRRAARRVQRDHAGRGGPDPRGALDQRRPRLSRASAPSTPGCATAAAPNYVAVTDADALAAFKRMAELEGIIPALESSHALAWVLADDAPADTVDLVCLSGRGDKDLAEALDKLGLGMTETRALTADRARRSRPRPAAPR